MASIKRVPVQWTTGPGGLGLSVFYTDTADDVTTNLATFFNAIKAYFQLGISWSIPSAGDTIDPITGELDGAWSGGTAASISGTSNTPYAAGTGAWIAWRTGVVLRGRKFQGRTFLCPLITGAYQNDGTIDPTVLSALQTAVTTLVGANKLMLWGRPTAPGAANGSAATITSGTVPDRVTSLRSRRS